MPVLNNSQDNQRMTSKYNNFASEQQNDLNQGQDPSGAKKKGAKVTKSGISPTSSVIKTDEYGN